ncbi:MAG: hypothetical protein ABH828_05230 [archaeon]
MIINDLLQFREDFKEEAKIIEQTLGVENYLSLRLKSKTVATGAFSGYLIDAIFGENIPSDVRSKSQMLTALTARMIANADYHVDKEETPVSEGRELILNMRKILNGESDLDLKKIDTYPKRVLGLTKYIHDNYIQQMPLENQFVEMLNYLNSLADVQLLKKPENLNNIEQPTILQESFQNIDEKIDALMIHEEDKQTAKLSVRLGAGTIVTGGIIPFCYLNSKPNQDIMSSISYIGAFVQIKDDIKDYKSDLKNGCFTFMTNSKDVKNTSKQMNILSEDITKEVKKLSERTNYAFSKIYDLATGNDLKKIKVLLTL